MKQAKPLTLHRHHPAHKSTLLQPHRQIRGGRRVEGTKFRQRYLVNPRVFLKNS